MTIQGAPAPSIAIVVTHFGPAPMWLPAFFLSCRANPDVQWLIYGDIDVAFDVPDNVSFRPTSLEAFCARASDALGAPIRIERAWLRKLADLKTTYGVIFADDLRPFDWWACSDLDIVWGNLRGFVTPDMLEAYTIISSRERRMSGHFTLFRNTEAVNHTFAVIPNMAELLTTPRCERLDERLLSEHLHAHIRQLSMKARPRIYWEQEMTIDAAYQRALPNDDRGNLWWRAGRTFDAHGKERAYLHFHKLKADMKTIDFGFEDRPQAFRIHREGVYAG